MLELGKLEDIIQTMSIGQLNRFIVEQKAKGSDMVSMFEVERQNRFAYPMATFVLTVIGVSLSSRKVRGGTGLHIGVGIGLCFTYILVCKFAAEFAKSSNKPLLVFDQDQDGWYRWLNDAWVKVEEPVIEHTHFTATGTRFMEANGRKAISDLFARSFNR